MAREIKFRAWNGEEFYNDVSIFDKNEVVDFGDYEWTTEKVEAIEQYTGLNDKNGKEIYEGDIVKCILRPSAIMEDVITFVNGCFCVGVVPIVALSNFEIIGNIHENPELLGGKK